MIHEALGTVDFKPTLLGLLGVGFDEPCGGRDASRLLRSGKAPEGWENIAYVRIGDPGGGAGKGWVGAFSSRHKLVLSQSDPPGFFDLDEDPNELRNQLATPEHRGEIRRLAKALKAYGETCKEPHLESAAIKADLEWAIGGTGAYDASKRPIRTK